MRSGKTYAGCSLLFAAALFALSCSGSGSKPAATLSAASGTSETTGRSAATPAKTPIVLNKVSKVKVFLVSVGDNGKNGKKVGCEDSLVAVERSIKPNPAPLRASLEELLAVPEDLDAGSGRLSNYWKGSDLKLNSVDIKGGQASIDISGQLSVAGVCDEPRITGQIEATAKQFPTVKSVKVTVNGIPLAEAIR